jgi:hypothetical protein
VCGVCPPFSFCVGFSSRGAKCSPAQGKIQKKKCRLFGATSRSFSPQCRWRAVFVEDHFVQKTFEQWKKKQCKKKKQTESVLVLFVRHPKRIEARSALFFETVSKKSPKTKNTAAEAKTEKKN